MNKPTLTPAQKEAIGHKVLEAYEASGFPSRAKYATSIGITSSDFTNIQKQNWRKNDQLLSVQKWLRIAHRVGFEFTARAKWVTAPTATYRTISRQLQLCQAEGISAIFCDEAGLGKTHIAKEYCAKNQNAFYVNGGSAPRKVAFVRALAQAIGLSPDKSTIEELLEDIITYLKALQNPIIVIDEAGDLNNATYLLLKRLYNELEFVCGLYLLGARGLRKRIDSAIRNRTNGFEEVFSRFGSRYSNVIPVDSNGKALTKERLDYLREEATMVAHANGFTDAEKLNRLLSRDFDLRTIRREVIKSRMTT